MQEPTATSLRFIRDGVAIWEVFSPHHKVDLTSAAIVGDGCLHVFDPVPLEEKALQSLESLGRPNAVILTNENHFRDSVRLQRRWKVPFVAGGGARLEDSSIQRLSPAQNSFEGFQVIDLEGGAGGELAFFHPAIRALVVGDALFNLPGHGFDVLPARYCQDRPALLSRLRTLLELDFDLLLMAHGEPICGDPVDRLRELLDRVAA